MHVPLIPLSLPSHAATRRPKASLAWHILLLALPLILLASWSVWLERDQRHQAQIEVARAAQRAAMVYASHTAERLNTEFIELQFAAVALLGPEANPALPPPRVATALHRFIALHPDLYAFNIQSPGGNTILWSTRSQSPHPIASGAQFTPLASRANFLLGRVRYAARVRGYVLTMRYRVKDARGRTRYFVGAPYRLATLLSVPGTRLPWTFTVIDTRNDSVFGEWAHHTVSVPPTPHASQGVRTPVAGYPLSVQVNWSPTLARQNYLASAPMRWALEAGTLFILFAATYGVLILIRQRDRNARRWCRLADCNALLADTNRIAPGMADARSLYEQVCHAAVKHHVTRWVWIGAPDPASGVFDILAAAGAIPSLDDRAVSHRAEAPGGHDPAGTAWREDRPVFAPGLQPARSSHRGAPAGRQGSSACAALPIHAQGQVVAVLSIGCTLADLLDETRQTQLMELVLNIEQGLMALWQRERLDNLQHMYRALMSEGEILLQARSSDEMLLRTCQKLVRDTLFHAVWVGRPDVQERFEVLARAGRGAEHLDTLKVTVCGDPSPCPVTQAWASQRLAYTNDALATAQQAPGYDFLVTHHWHATLAAPLFRDGRCWALLVFVSPYRDVFDTETIELCQRVAALLGHGLDELDIKHRLNILQHKEAYRARHDPLTGLPNRFALNMHLSKAIARAQRNDSVLAVGLIDLDDFKPINDTWGHETGDRLLQELAKRLQAWLRDSDIVARFGGDEFVVVIEELDKRLAVTQLTAALERLRHTVDAPFDIAEGKQTRVSMTMGLALCPLEAEEPDALLRLADTAMYQAKLHKADRTQWWSIGDASVCMPVRQDTPDPYGTEACALLERMQAHFTIVTGQFVETFYAELGTHAQSRAILHHLSASERQQLKTRQSEHLHFLLASTTTQQAIMESARHLGQIHALVGVDGALIVQSMTLYRKLLSDHLNQALLRTQDRYTLLLTADARLHDDIQAQLSAAAGVAARDMDVLSVPLPAHGALWADIRATEITALGQLPGIQAALFMRLDNRGIFVVENSAGPQADAITAILQTPGAQAVIDIHCPRGQGLTAQVWRSQRILSSPSYTQDSRYQAWHPQAMALNIRSTLSVPILNAQGQVVAVISLFGAYPNQFESIQKQQFARALQQRWALIWQRCNTPVSVITQTQSQQWRQRLFDGGLHMYMQPIVNLQSGRLIRVEALARLQMPDAQIIPPDKFLPLLGNAELDRLFYAGMDETLAQRVRWEAQGLAIGVALNLPPSCLLDAGCPRWVQEALQRHGVAPRHLTLELLETADLDNTVQDKAIRQLKTLGVKLAMDDLGSGYSSLKRLTCMPFDTIKLDKGLLLHLREDPLQGLILIRTIIQLGLHSERDVVVEGLEQEDMIETARMLGASLGQGYGLARPMPAEQIFDWNRTFKLPLQPDHIQTYLGALTYHWTYLHDDAKTCDHPTPLSQCPVTRFLADRGLQDSEAARWHTHIHTGTDVQEPYRRLTDWLIERVQHGQAADK